MVAIGQEFGRFVGVIAGLLPSRDRVHPLTAGTELVMVAGRFAKREGINANLINHGLILLVAHPDVRAVALFTRARGLQKVLYVCPVLRTDERLGEGAQLKLDQARHVFRQPGTPLAWRVINSTQIEGELAIGRVREVVTATSRHDPFEHFNPPNNFTYLQSPR